MEIEQLEGENEILDEGLEDNEILKFGITLFVIIMIIIGFGVVIGLNIDSDMRGIPNIDYSGKGNDSDCGCEDGEYYNNTFIIAFGGVA